MNKENYLKFCRLFFFASLSLSLLTSCGNEEDSHLLTTGGSQRDKNQKNVNIGNPPLSAQKQQEERVKRYKTKDPIGSALAKLNTKKERQELLNKKLGEQPKELKNFLDDPKNESIFKTPVLSTEEEEAAQKLAKHAGLSEKKRNKISNFEANKMRSNYHKLMEKYRGQLISHTNKFSISRQSIESLYLKSRSANSVFDKDEFRDLVSKEASFAKQNKGTKKFFGHLNNKVQVMGKKYPGTIKATKEFLKQHATAFKDLKSTMFKIRQLDNQFDILNDEEENNRTPLTSEEIEAYNSQSKKVNEILGKIDSANSPKELGDLVERFFELSSPQYREIQKEHNQQGVENLKNRLLQSLLQSMNKNQPIN